LPPMPHQAVSDLSADQEPVGCTVGPHKAREHGSLPGIEVDDALAEQTEKTLPQLSRIDREWRSIIRLTSALGGSSA
jgi:hypothetical protein